MKKISFKASNSRILNKLKPFFKAPCYWSYDVEPVARGVAAGLAGAMIPGFQIFYAALLAVLFRGNLPISLLFTLITNPITAIPVIYFIYYIGTLIMGNGKTNFVVHELQWDFSSFHAFWSNLSTWMLQFGKAFFIGLPIVSVGLAIIGYFGTHLLWKLFTYFFGKKRIKRVAER